MWSSVLYYSSSLRHWCLQSLDANEQFLQCPLCRQEVAVYGREMLHPFLTNEVLLFIELSLVSKSSLKKGGGHQVLRGHKARLSGSKKSVLPFLPQFLDPRINDLALESVVKSILAVKERRLLSVDYSTDFLEGKFINVKGGWHKAA